MEEKLSALVDGEADPDEVPEVLAKLRTDQLFQDRWRDYHLIGDVLRNDTVVFSDNFASKLGQRLAEEPTILAPRRSGFMGRMFVPLAAAASIAAVGLVGMAAMQVNKINEAPVTLASNNVPAQVVVQPVQQKTATATASNDTVNPYLLAHQEYSPSTTMEGVVPYVRSVADVRQDSAQ